MRVVAVYSEAGGVTKTTTAVSVAACSAERGLKTLLVDLDPRGAASQWVGAQPLQEGLDVSAIFADADPDGWAADMAVAPKHDKGWPEGLEVIPSARQLATVESMQTDGIHLRLRRALVGNSADVVVLDCPNRQGGPLTNAALWASDAVFVAAKPDGDGLAGVHGAVQTIKRHAKSVASLGLRPAEMRGIIVGAVATTVVPRVERFTIDQLDEDYPGLVVRPFVPARTIVKECRQMSEWVGRYSSSASLAFVEAYRKISEVVMESGS